MNPEDIDCSPSRLPQVVPSMDPLPQRVGLHCGNQSVCCPGSPVCSVFPADATPSPAIYADLIGKPFAYGGRGPNSYDCYGLVKEVFRRSGMEIPDYPSSTDGEENAVTFLAAMKDRWLRLAEPCRAGVVVIVTFRMTLAWTTHCGAVIAPDRFIHVHQDTATVLERLSSPAWRHRITGFFRWIG